MLAETMVQTKRDLQTALPFAMDPVVMIFVSTTTVRLQTSKAIKPTCPIATMRQVTLNFSAGPRAICRDNVVASWNGSQCVAKSDANLRTATLLLDSVLPQSTQVAKSSSDTLVTQLAAAGFDREQHEQIRTDLRSGRIGCLRIA